jgi:hypothetical protein
VECLQILGLGECDTILAYPDTLDRGAFPVLKLGIEYEDMQSCSPLH